LRICRLKSIGASAFDDVQECTRVEYDLQQDETLGDTKGQKRAIEKLLKTGAACAQLLIEP
jgi:hypothetical protein